MIYTDGPWFKDAQGRTLTLHGVNLSGSSKVPFHPDGATYIREGFFDHRNVSFVGRPFPLAEADEHLARLRSWGLSFLRLLVTWEAIEHAGPGIYDEAYLDYIYQVARKAGEYGIDLFVDPHQDVWSRFSGGDGAPGWTLEAVGMDMTRFAETGAAIVHATYGDPFPRMVWPSNGTKLAAATMFTLFFAGNDFAPRTLVDGVPVQEYLQGHYLDAIKQVAMRLRDLPNVVGYDTLNEPLHGYIGCPDLRVAEGMIKVGEVPSPYQSMLLGSGFPQEVEVYEQRMTGIRRVGTRLLNPNGLRAWRESASDVWLENGVWDIGPDGEPRLLRPDYFASVDRRPVEFARDYYRPFANRYAREIRSVHPDVLIFLEAEAEGPGGLIWEPDDARGVVYAPHWYDIAVLFFKDFSPWMALDRNGHLVLTAGQIRNSFASQLQHFKVQAAERMGGIPTLVGEFGIAYDMKDKKAYRTGDFRPQISAMDRSMTAMEDDLLSFTLWNYTPDNTNARGDQWNDEDLSVFSRDQQASPGDINSGGRALPAVVRPYANKVAGEPLRTSFELKRRLFEFEFRHDPAVTAPTEVFVPNLQYPEGFEVELSDGAYEVNRERQMLIYRHSEEWHVHVIRVRPSD